MDRCEPDDSEWFVFWTLGEKWKYTEEGPFEKIEEDVPEVYYEAVPLFCC